MQAPKKGKTGRRVSHLKCNRADSTFACAKVCLCRFLNLDFGNFKETLQSFNYICALSPLVGGLDWRFGDLNGSLVVVERRWEAPP